MSLSLRAQASAAAAAALPEQADDAGVRAPMEYRYMRMTRELMHWIGSWPYRQLGEDRPFYPMRSAVFMMNQCVVLVVGQFLYVWVYSPKLEFVIIGHSYITLFMSLVCLQRFTLNFTAKYHEAIGMFVNEMHLFYFRHNSQFAMEMHQKMHFISKWFCYVKTFMGFIAVLLFNLTPLLINYRAGMFGNPRPPNGTYEQSTYYLLPFDYTTNFKGHLAVYIANCVFTVNVTLVFVMFDTFMSLLVLHTWGHLKVLDHNLRHFPEPEMKNRMGSFVEDPPWYTAEETRHIRRLLKENIDYHRLLMNFVHTTSSAFGLTLFVYCTFFQVCGCIFLLECSSLDSAAMGKYGLLTLVAFQELVQVSVVFELVATSGEALVDAVYAVPWECMGIPERRTLFIFLINVQASPLSFKALGLVPVGVRTMAAILKTSVSYFVMLRTMSGTS